MKNIGFYIFTTFKNYNRCKLIEQTWGKDQDLYFFTDKISEEENYICCTSDSTYISHIYKNFYAIQYAYIKHKNKYDWFMFIGDDTYIYTDNLYKTILKLNKNDNTIYGQVQNCWPNDKSLFYALGGGGIMFNSFSLESFIKYPININILNSFHYSDVAIGDIARKLSINLENIEGIHSQRPEFYGINNPEKYISFHYIKDKNDFLLLSKYL